jgi:hypothetical protein
MNTTNLPSVGQPLEGGFYGGKIQINGALFAVIWAPKAPGETEAVWLPSRKQVPNATSFCDSMANTVAMAEAGSPLAQWARGLDIGGHTDWCIPARDVLELAYRHLKPTDCPTGNYFRDGDNPSSVPVGYPYSATQILKTTVEAFQEGGPEAFADEWYWASTQYSEDCAWYQDFGNGDQGCSKDDEFRARAVRMIPLNP